MAGDHPGQQGEVVLDDLRGDRHRGHVDHPQPGLAQQHQQEQEPLLVGLGDAAAGRHGPVEGDRGDDDHRLVVVVEAHRVPDLAHPGLQLVEAAIALVLVELGQHVGRGGRWRPEVAGHDSVRALSMPLTSNAWTLRLNPRSSRVPASSPTASGPAAENTRSVTRICHGSAVGAQPGGQVGDAPDRRVVVPALEADPAQGGVALGDPDAEGEVVALASPGLRQAADPGPHRDAHPDRARRTVVAAHRVVEEDHQPVAGEPLERALEPEDQVAERGVVLLQDAHHLLGLARLGERGEPAQVAEHHDDLAPVALEERLVAGVDDQLGQLRRQEAAQPAHPLDLGHLRRHAALQLLVPGRELVGLALDRVLVALDPGQRGHPGEQLVLVDRLGQEVVGTGLERLDLLLVAARRDHHDRQVRRAGPLPDLAGTPRSRPCPASRCRGGPGPCRPASRAASASSPGRRRPDVVPARRQDRLEQPDVRRLVVDDQHARASAGAVSFMRCLRA